MHALSVVCPLQFLVFSTPPHRTVHSLAACSVPDHRQRQRLYSRSSSQNARYGAWRRSRRTPRPGAGERASAALPFYLLAAVHDKITRHGAHVWPGPAILAFLRSPSGPVQRTAHA
jgi:hypothetical protein